MKNIVRNMVRNPLFVVILYAVFGFLWIKYSDQFLETMVTDISKLTQLQTYKGWLFIGVTSTLLYLLVYNNIRANIKHEQHRRNFMMSTPLPLIVVHDNGTVIFMNSSFTKTYGYTRKDIPTTEEWMTNAYPDEMYRKEVMKEWNSVLQGWKDGVEEHFLFTVADKKGEKHEVRFFLVKQEESVIILCIDITKENELEARLRQSEKMNAIGQLAGGIAHDFNNQLGVIQGFVQLLELDDCIKETNNQALTSILQAVEHSKELTAQLLLFSRKEKRELETIDIKDILTEVKSIIDHTFPKSIHCSIELADSLLFCKGNRSLLINAILNLAINARDAMGNEGRIKLSTGCSGSMAVIIVEDTGGGIPDDVLPHIFEPFYTTKDEGAGTGMGLSTVYGVIEFHNGEITVKSRSGVGTTFTITIPLKK